MSRFCHIGIFLATLLLGVSCADARILSVGSRQFFKLPSQAAQFARDGDVVRIDPGVYVDCAHWSASRLMIEATGPGVVFNGKTCFDQAIFIISGHDVIVRGITFAGAQVIWHNGAGIRASGTNLTVEHSRFINNENGILFGGSSASVLRITDSEFIGNGACINACAHGVYAGEPIYLLDIERCVFRDTRVGHHIKSRALNTVIRDSLIEDGPSGTSSYLIETPNGGNLLIQGNVLEKGPNSSNATTAISIGIEGVTNPTNALIVQDNVFRNDLPGQVIFVRNSTNAPVALIGNTISGDVDLLEFTPSRGRSAGR